MSHRLVKLVGYMALAVSAASAARASPYTAEYVFGDSLSDNGNLAAAFNTTFPNPPSFNNSFTNGPVAVQLLAQSLGLPLNASRWTAGFPVTGTNYAVAGATSAPRTGVGVAPIDLGTQVSIFNAAVSTVADPAALYVVMIGGNDVRNAARLSGTANQQAAIGAGVAAEVQAIATLASIGARDFLVVNVPNVGVIPEFQLGDPADAPAATTLSQLYDSELAAGIGALSLAGTSITQFDLYAFNTNLLANASSYGLTDTTTPCYTNTPLSAATTPACGTGAANIGSFVYWDAIHPTASVHALWAQGFEAALVPEPASIAALAAALLALVASAARFPRRRVRAG